MNRILYINTVPDIRIKEMVSDTKGNALNDDVHYYPDPSEPHEENN